MVKGLIVLNSSINGSRDLWWPHDLAATRGYHVYRAQDAPINWKRITPYTIPVHYFRDETKLELVCYPVEPNAWIDAGEMGQKCLRLPDVPYTEVQQGRPTVAGHPQDISVQITMLDGTVSYTNPVKIDGLDQTIWLAVGQGLPYGGAADYAPVIDWPNVASVKVMFRRMVNFVDIITNMVRTFYCVIPVTEYGEEHAPGILGSDVVDNLQVDSLDYIFAEMARRNQWMLEQAAEPAHLLFRRVSGERCGCSSDFTKGRTACPSCYETGIKGGYYGPIEFLFLDPDVAATRTIDEGGTKVERQSQSWITRVPVIQDGDMIVRRNGERLVISGVVWKMPRGVICQQNYNVELLTPGDTRYLIPLFEPEKPVLFNPAQQLTAGPGSQPVFVEGTMPGQKRENPVPQVGRTVAFGLIQG